MAVDLESIFTNQRTLISEFSLNTDDLRVEFIRVGGTATDFWWGVCNELLIMVTKSESLDRVQKLRALSTIYLEMTHFQRNMENKKGHQTLEQFFKTYIELESIQLEHFKTSIEVLSGACCKYCDKLNGKKVSMKSALVKVPIDVNKCKREWGCNCTITANIER